MAASAGYGLLAEQDSIVPYSCTFAESSPDGVAIGQPRRSRDSYNRAWWRAIAEYSTNRRMVEKFSEPPDAGLLVLGSPDYVNAMHDDLVTLASCRRRERLVIITSGADWASSSLREHIVVVDERVRVALGGTMQAIHARAALALLRAHSSMLERFAAAEFRAIYETLVSDVHRRERPARPRMRDDEVLTFLRAELAKFPDAGWTLLLRVLRGSGRACEQRRFRRLHAQVTEELRAGMTR